MKIHERYNYKDLKTIFEDTDLLVAPSIWYETFGFTVLEAVSYSVPVIISDTVGAKDILPKGGGIIIEHLSKENLCEAIYTLTPYELKKMNQILVANTKICTLNQMNQEIIEKCYM